jgi:methylphosphotriester-DNA--protein-cysteine methyltransferase
VTELAARAAVVATRTITASDTASTQRFRLSLMKRMAPPVLSSPEATVALSPHHLSRVFSECTGESISRYRNRIRVRLALDRLVDGERSLRSEVGQAPARLRRLVSARGL